ncbi:MAG: hypothetical protein J5986_12535, partial [Roseburia sp.]|nr:hypothetical protein [Roseburia sp.]
TSRRHFIQNKKAVAFSCKDNHNDYVINFDITKSSCSKLGTITIKSTKLSSVGKNAFEGIKSTAKIKVPAKKLSAYKKLLKGKGQGSKVKITK